MSDDEEEEDDDDQSADENADADGAEADSEEVGLPWVHVGLVVKVLDQELKGGKYYGRKGTIFRLEDEVT